MFNLGIAGNTRVNGHVPDLASKQDLQDSEPRKRRGRPAVRVRPYLTHGSASIANGPLSNNGPPDSLSSSPLSGSLKFSDRLKALLPTGNETGAGDSQQVFAKDTEDPYAFNEPEPVARHHNPNTKTTIKTSGRSLVKSKAERIGVSSSSSEPTGLNMTRLYPAISASLGHSFNSPQSTVSPHTSDPNKTTLASLLESAADQEDDLPKSTELERTFASFSAKELNCFPNLTSPPPPEQTPTTNTVLSSKVSPVKHGMPSTPQRESNKLAALFSPTYPNSIRNDKSRTGKTSAARTLSRERPRVAHCDKRLTALKEVVKSTVFGIADANVKKTEDASKTTMSRLQDKIARNRVIGKHRKADVPRGPSEMPTRRHSVNDLPVRRERSLLEEQLLGYKPPKPVKKEELSRLPSPPAATTRVPGMVTPLSYGIARSTPNSPRSNCAPNSARQPRAPTSSGTPKSAKSQGNISLQKHTALTYGPARNNNLARQSNGGSVPSGTRVTGRLDVSKPGKRSRTKLDIATESLKHEPLQRLHTSKDVKKHDIYYKNTVVVTDNEDSDLEEGLVYQKHWFSGWREAGSGLAGEERREGRLSQLRAELRRKLGQVWGGKRDPARSALPKCIIDAALTKPSQTALLLAPNQPWHRTGRSKLAMLVQKQCVFGKHGEGDQCHSLALPCAHHCIRHIMYNVDQQLFEHCTAKFSDNTPCSVPVFDFSHELPLCSEHARKLDNYNRMCQETKPKRVRKKAKPSAMTRSSKRSKKKKQKPAQSQPLSPLPTHNQTLAESQPQIQAQARIQRSQSLPIDSLCRRDSEDCFAEASSSPTGSAEIYVTDDSFVQLSESEPDVPVVNGKVEEMTDVSGVDVVEEEVLAMAADLPLDTADLAQQATGLLEEHDLTNVLNQIPADAFNDLFIEDKSGEPTREETEELERALAAVTKDVKSLERLSGGQILLDYKAQDLLQVPQTQAQVYLEVDKLSQAHGLLDIDKIQTQALFDEKNTQGLLENFLDDQTLVQTLTAQLPTDLPSSSSGLVYYHNGYSVSGNGVDKSLGVVSGSSPLYQTPGMAGVPLPTQTDLHS